MSGFQNLIEDLALLIGGTAQAAPPPGFYSGSKAKDGTGVPGLKGCYAQPPMATPAELPAGILLPQSFKATLASQGYEDNLDVIRLLVLVKKVDMAIDLSILIPLRDAVSAIFRTHIQVDTAPGALSLLKEPLWAYAKAGKTGTVAWAGETFYGFDFQIECRRVLNVTYTP